MVFSRVPPLPIFIAFVQLWFFLYFYFIFHQYLMYSLYLTAIVMITIAFGLHHLVFQPVDKSVSNSVFRKENDEDHLVFAHRGGAHDAPENTIVAIREAKKNGADGVEIDLSFTKDSIAILFHDDTLERTTNGFGKLSSKTFAQIRELDAAANHIYRDRFKGEKVATLEEAIEECLKLNLKLILDVKEYDNRAVAVVSDMFKKHPELYQTTLVASFFPTFVYQLRRVDPKIVTALTFRPRFLSYDDIINGKPWHNASWKTKLALAADSALEWAFHNVLWYATGVSAVLIHKDYLSAEYVRMWKSRGIQVFAWTPNQHLEKDYLKKVLNVSYISDTLL